MVSVIQSRGKQILLLLTIIIFSGSNMLAQNGSYIGQEDNISLDQLINIAEDVDLSNSLCIAIHEDVKNSYYVVNSDKLESKYEKIRLLELSYSDDALVSIGMNIEKTKFFYLVNNTLNKTPEDIDKLFEGFVSQSKTEMDGLNAEQMRLWLIQHDKYYKK